MSKIYFISKPRRYKPVFYAYPNLDAAIHSGIVVKETPSGFRIKRKSGMETQCSNNHYWFFSTYSNALEFLAMELNKTAAYHEEEKLKAVRLMSKAHDALRKGGIPCASDLFY